ncbi:uncharacterized protein CIMG_12629 [Coccidioides immitis RS]|uniref:Uncharacterized protein n=1 Tax=Coccidioides immitis (strain RS) TaxID=246410 RepID=A0A0D8JRH4_COCIM|nr:uncharacterized protein CIMG_12629 [Coccidioides immitis RS]KJF59950.1 hypothetical protein CIMG_12629 [Coccidioides immitis RS]
MCARNKEYFDNTHNIQTNPLLPGDLVLLHNTKEEQNMSRNNTLHFQWLELYRVKSANQELGAYHLEELDGTELKESIAENRLKKYLMKPEMELFNDSSADSDVEMENISQRYATRNVSFLDQSENENDQEEMEQTQFLTVIPDDWSFAVVIPSQDV